MERRQFVKLAGMTSVAATAGLAGCQDGGDGDGDETTEGGDGNGGVTGEMAPYNSWLAADAVNNPTELLCVTLDTQALQELGGSETASETPSSEVRGDALFSLPSGFLFIGAFAAFGFSGVGLGQLTEGEDSPTNTIHIAGGGLVAEGDYDPASLASSVESAGLSESEEYNGYTIYEGAPGAAALSDSAVVVVSEGDDLTGQVKSHIDADAGDATLYSDEEETFADLASALPSRPIMGCVHTTEPEALNQSDGSGSSDPGSLANTDLDGPAHGIANSSTIGDSSLTSSAAIRYASESDVNDQATIESALGAAANEQTVSINGALVVVTGEYSDLPSLQ